MTKVLKSFKGKIITLCGSTKFKEEYLWWQKELSLQGHIVLSVGLWPHADKYEYITPEQKEMLDELHLRKIDLSDAIYVINPGEYIGESTKKEVDYALANEKVVNFTTPMSFESLMKHGWRPGHGKIEIP